MIIGSVAFCRDMIIDSVAFCRVVQVVELSKCHFTLVLLCFSFLLFLKGIGWGLLERLESDAGNIDWFSAIVCCFFAQGV